jgi:hypothetical protein
MALADVDVSALANVKLLQRMRMLEQLGSQFGQKRLKDLKFMGGWAGGSPAPNLKLSCQSSKDNRNGFATRQHQGQNDCNLLAVWVQGQGYAFQSPEHILSVLAQPGVHATCDPCNLKPHKHW